MIILRYCEQNSDGAVKKGMLRELNIKNLAIIDNVTISFREGMDVITGETGAGKSIIIGAVNLLLGERATSDIVRSTEEAATVEALFDIGNNERVREALTKEHLLDGDELIMKRIVSRSGKNRVYINGSLVNLSTLAKISESLVNICGQHEHQELLNRDNHIDILDDFGNLVALREEYGKAHRQYLSLSRRLEELKKIDEEKRKHRDLLEFQLKEIEAAGVVPDEDGVLDDEKKIITNAKRLREWSDEAYQRLYQREGSILEEFDTVKGLIAEISAIDPALDMSRGDCETLSIGIEEMALTLRDYAQTVSYDEERLEAIEQRLEVLRGLKRKYGGTLEQVVATMNNAKKELESLSTRETEITGLLEKIEAAREEVKAKARDLSDRRKEAAETLASAVESEIHALMMKNTRCEVRVSVRRKADGIAVLNAKGMDDVEFYLSPNVGEELRPLSRIASGGELSRIVLAMKKVLSKTGGVGTIIFDEVDSGIGGATAEVVGQKLKDVSRHHQVICITHLPQIACYGETHYRVEKRVADERTRTEVRLLSDTDRLDEISRMLGGVEVTDATRRHAGEMLNSARSDN